MVGWLPEEKALEERVLSTRWSVPATKEMMSSQAGFILMLVAGAQLVGAGERNGPAMAHPTNTPLQWSKDGHVFIQAPRLLPFTLKQEAEAILLHQRESGGWPKNYERKRVFTNSQRLQLSGDASRNDATVDNGATHTEIRILARAYAKTRDDRYRDSALRGIRYLLGGQYQNGGWPQRFPQPRGYQCHVTFNDNAMIGVMTLLRDIGSGNAPYDFVPPGLQRQCGSAMERGIACILKCQIRVAGKLTAWCAQHDAHTLAPRKARSYELASLSGLESVGIVRFLMGIEKPSEEVVTAIEGAVSWFDTARLEGIRLVRREDDSKARGFDYLVVEDLGAGSLWARFYDIRTNQPIFCSRDGVPRQSLSEISYERRTGYSWIGPYAEELFRNDLPAWRKRVN